MGKRISKGHLGGNILGGDPNTFYPKLWDFFINKYRPKNILDIGCGEGYSLNHFRDKGIRTVGVDGIKENISQCIRMGHGGHVVDFTLSPFLGNEMFDFGWCCEVVEHIEEKYVQNIIDSFKYCKILAMTHAVPRQGGYHHVNCQPSSYWISLMEKNGFNLLEKDTLKSKNFDGNPYYNKSGMIFENLNFCSKTLSFCVPLYNFSEYFEKVFPENYKNILEYPHFSFSVCVYGGNKDEAKFLIDKGYIKEEKVRLVILGNEYFNTGRAKNIAHLAASSDFVMNCDGDNLLSKDYLKTLNETFLKNINTEKLFIRCGGKRLRGRVGCWKKDFAELGGYDSRRQGYWGDDRDFAKKAWDAGFNFVTLPDSKRFTLEKLHNPDKVSNFS